MFLPFENLRVTTQTYVVHTNLTIPLAELYACVKPTPVVQSYKKKFNVEKENLSDGDIIHIQFKNDSKGIIKDIKRKQMLNVVTVIVKYKNKLYNVKIAQSGKFQLTGCRDLESVIFIVGVIIRLLRQLGLYKQTSDAVGIEQTECYFICVMSNVNVEIPFKINRDKLHQYINQKTDHISILEKSVGYVGVNVKIASERERKEDVTIDKVTYATNGSYTKEVARYSDYLRACEKADKKYKKEMYNSFLIFESGKTIMSGCSSALNRRDAYEMFMRIVEEARDEICL